MSFQEHNLHRTLRQNKLTHDKQQQNVINYEDSITMAPHEISRFLDCTTSASPTLFLNDDQYSIAGTNSQMDSNKQHCADLLYGNFLEILQSRTNDSEVFETVKDLIQTCSDTLTEIERTEFRGKVVATTTDNRFNGIGNYNWLIQERNTWRLLYALYKDRLIVQKEASDEFDELPLSSSEKEIIEHLYASNSNLREYQLIVDWLEQSASEQETVQIGFYTDRTVCWENTLLQLKNIDQSMFGNTKDVVNSLDPDAPYREKLRLHDLDVEDQRRLSKQVNSVVKCNDFK